MSVLGGALLAVRFLLELAALASLAYWGFTEHDGAVSFLLGLAAPLVAAMVWGLFVSPKAKVDVPRPVRFAVELTILGAAAAALASTGHKTLAIGFAALAVLSGALNYASSS